MTGVAPPGSAPLAGPARKLWELGESNLRLSVLLGGERKPARRKGRYVARRNRGVGGRTLEGETRARPRGRAIAKHMIIKVTTKPDWETWCPLNHRRGFLGVDRSTLSERPRRAEAH